jgi:hypothetical protein
VSEHPCPHAHLIRLAEESGFTDQYQCEDCKDILVVSVQPFEIKAVWPTE